MRKSVIVSGFLAISLVVVALYVRSSREASKGTQLEVSVSQLAASNGQQGAACWLAVDGIVYEIDQGYKWQEGEHTESSSAYCGADMSNVIDDAPHGRTKISQLKKVGTLVQ